jgi:hypothetical protein
MMVRSLEAEWLDALSTKDPRAAASRRDLRRLNSLMGHSRIFGHLLGHVMNSNRLGSLIDLGGGDATFALAIARKLAQRPTSPAVRFTLVDKCNTVSDQTRRNLAAVGWTLTVVEADASDFVASRPPSCDVIIANLFLHHLPEASLARLLSDAAQLSPLFIACEPYRNWLPLIFSKLVGAIGCNAVTRHDAPASVRAGFSGKELSSLWPAGKSWVLKEYRAGPFSHCFVARHVG